MMKVYYLFCLSFPFSLSHLLRIAVVGKALAEKVTCTEKWYGTCYKMECVEEELLERWRDAGSNTLLRLPSRNEFVPTTFDLFKDSQVSRGE